MGPFRRFGWLLAMLFLGTACTPIEYSSWESVGSNGDVLIAVDNDSGNESPSHLTSTDDGITWSPLRHDSELLDDAGISNTNRMCLTSNDQVCVRVVGDVIQESLDAGQTYTSAWELDLAGGWLARQTDQPITIKPGTMIETRTGAVLVAVGSIEPVRRSPDGRWTPAEEHLRAFPGLGVFFILAGVAVLAYALTAGPLRVFRTVSGVALIGGGWMGLHMRPADLLVLIIVLGFLFLVPASILGLIVLFSPRRRTTHIDWDWHISKPLIWLIPIAVVPAVFAGWAAVLIKWDTAQLAALTSIITAISLNSIAKRSDTRKSQKDEHPNRSVSIDTSPR